MKRFLTVGYGLFVLAAGTAAGEAQTNIAPRAETILRSACNFLSQTHAFSLSAEIWREHVNEAGQKIQYSRTVEMDVKRPNGLRLEIGAPLSARGFWYDGKALTILDRKHNWYSIADMPSTLDKAADAAHDQGIDIPLIDLALKDPYRNATAKVEKGADYGLAPVLGVSCHHLAFTQENVDWQIWIEDGPQPLIRKFVITYKNETDSPEFTALITHWDLTDRIADSDFEFTPPAGTTKIEMQTEKPGENENK
jgi:hypothetical protein